MIRPVLTSASDFFNPAQGGDPVSFQNSLWLLGHPSVWVSIFALLINFAVMFALSRHSHFGKGLSVIWLGAILYAASMKYRYFSAAMDPLTTSQINLINFIHIGIVLIATLRCLWVASRVIKQQKHRKGLSQK